jgi:hypothetical protein
LTATADELLSSLTTIPADPFASFNLWSLPVSPRLKIETTAAGVFGVPGSFVNLRSPYSVAGPSIFEAHAYPTSVGSLVIPTSSEVPGTFRIAPVPTPLPALALAAAFARFSCTPPPTPGS